MAQLFRIAGVPEHFNLPWWQAAEDDAFARLPLDVRFVEEPGGTGAMTEALQDGVAPGTRNSTRLDEVCGPQFLLANEECRIACAMSQSFGFGGSNTTIVVGRA